MFEKFPACWGLEVTECESGLLNEVNQTLAGEMAEINKIPNFNVGYENI